MERTGRKEEVRERTEGQCRDGGCLVVVGQVSGRSTKNSWEMKLEGPRPPFNCVPPATALHASQHSGGALQRGKGGVIEPPASVQ